MREEEKRRDLEKRKKTDETKEQQMKREDIITRIRRLDWSAKED